jgi:UPF0755 protein
LRKKLLLVLAAIPAALILGLGGYLLWYGHQRLHPGDGIFEVAPGTGLGQFARRLAAAGVLPGHRGLLLWSYLQGSSRDLKAGEYRFEDGITSLELLDQVTSGRVVVYTLPLIEGHTLRQSLAVMAAAPKLKHTLADVAMQDLLVRIGASDKPRPPEGLFYPDTYHYIAGTSDAEILRQAYQRMEVLLEREWPGREPDLPLASPYEALVLASIVEKETGVADERPLIAGVFINRLRRGMLLQTDPTVIYGLGDKFDGNLKLKHLKQDSPYNTYTRAGLPPTPIATPGVAAIQAVLHPAKTKALYFVARGDGSHHFSRTLKEHNAAVIKFQLGGRARPTSSNPAGTRP